MSYTHMMRIKDLETSWKLEEEKVRKNRFLENRDEDERRIGKNWLEEKAFWPVIELK